MSELRLGKLRLNISVPVKRRNGEKRKEPPSPSSEDEFVLAKKYKRPKIPTTQRLQSIVVKVKDNLPNHIDIFPSSPQPTKKLQQSIHREYMYKSSEKNNSIGLEMPEDHKLRLEFEKKLHHKINLEESTPPKTEKSSKKLKTTGHKRKEKKRSRKEKKQCQKFAGSKSSDEFSPTMSNKKAKDKRSNLSQENVPKSTSYIERNNDNTFEEPKIQMKKPDRENEYFQRSFSKNCSLDNSEKKQNETSIELSLDSSYKDDSFKKKESTKNSLLNQETLDTKNSISKDPMKLSQNPLISTPNENILGFNERGDSTKDIAHKISVFDRLGSSSATCSTPKFQFKWHTKNDTLALSRRSFKSEQKPKITKFFQHLSKSLDDNNPFYDGNITPKETYELGDSISITPATRKFNSICYSPGNEEKLLSFITENKEAIMNSEEEKIESENLCLSYYKLFKKNTADRIFQHLEDNIEYFSGDMAKVKIHGQWRNIPRKQVAFGDEGLTYTFSGNTFPAKPWTPLLKLLCQRVSEIANAEFNFVLINRYNDGRDHIGEHRDDEPDLDPYVPIASMSFGQHREFLLRHKDLRFNKSTRIPEKRITLEHGTLLLMHYPTNNFWYHSLPRCNSKFPRINLTFRRILP